MMSMNILTCLSTNNAVLLSKEDEPDFYAISRKYPIPELSASEEHTHPTSTFTHTQSAKRFRRSHSHQPGQDQNTHTWNAYYGYHHNQNQHVPMAPYPPTHTHHHIQHYHIDIIQTIPSHPIRILNDIPTIQVQDMDIITMGILDLLSQVHMISIIHHLLLTFMIDMQILHRQIMHQIQEP